MSNAKAWLRDGLVAQSPKLNIDRLSLVR